MILIWFQFYLFIYLSFYKYTFSMIISIACQIIVGLHLEYMQIALD